MQCRQSIRQSSRAQAVTHRRRGPGQHQAQSVGTLQSYLHSLEVRRCTHVTYFHSLEALACCAMLRVCVRVRAVCVRVRAVLGRFVYALCEYCEQELGFSHQVTDFWSYEFAKVRDTHTHTRTHTHTHTHTLRFLCLKSVGWHAWHARMHPCMCVCVCVCVCYVGVGMQCGAVCRHRPRISRQSALQEWHTCSRRCDTHTHTHRNTHTHTLSEEHTLRKHEKCFSEYAWGILRLTIFASAL